MITDREAALAMAATYGAGNPTFASLDSAIRVFLSDAPDGSVTVSIEGTHDPLGWAIDFLAIGVRDREMVHHPSVGMVEAGFLLAAQSVIGAIGPAVAGKRFNMIGHSLGAALALLLGALLGDEGHAADAIHAFAPPRVGYDDFLAALKRIGSAVRAFRFHNDPVPLAPLTLPPLWPYRQVPLIGLGPAPTHALDPADHHYPNYVNAIS